MVVETRREMENLIRHIRETQASRSVIKESKTHIEQKLASFQEEDTSTEEQSFAIGDFVFSSKLKLSGRVVDVLEGYAKVESENVRFLAPLDTLELKEKQSEMKDAPVEDMDIEEQSELDIRGLMVEEAKPVVTQFIDHAILANLRVVQIIHGKGTGALRDAVSDILKADKRVDTFRLGYHTEGGSGVTIVNLKE
jgi:DNA mismatch repair protein MutS2